ncbi:exported hypothetical protein [Desulfamplus magnetovallimortis]|uniref:Uncharacterized protein n=1 Tax=Desulfamplus magnetovallimortis TaxID=1246637 RepID=A0A1W1HF28_9BACT|nr:hypothetical protein [Desulfamplus magnetovallimortis]SLM31111.1 exported hypothetical protein [Desulfamplus magnetovallimortis]
MKIFIVLLIFLTLTFPCSICAKESDDQFFKELLESNYHSTPYTSWVKVVSVEEKKDMHFYPTYALTCDVIEIFKGLPLKRITYLKSVEGGYQKYPVGKEYIVSLFINPETGIYYIGDNGYDLPFTEALLKILRGIKED